MSLFETLIHGGHGHVAKELPLHVGSAHVKGISMRDARLVLHASLPGRLTGYEHKRGTGYTLDVVGGQVNVHLERRLA